jgi:hypothetical protein
MTFAAVIIALFMFVGAYMMRDNIITGTTVTDTVVQTALPIVLAVIILVLIIGVFRKS